MTQHAQTPLEALPIDIHYSKLLDWLLNRRHCTQQCQSYLTLIRDKMGKALAASRAENHTNARIKEILSMDDHNYFVVRELFELLKGTDAGKTNLIGQYSQQSMKNWAEIMKLYAKDGTYLVESSQLISRNVNFEVPAIKKQINKCQQTQKDCARKETESLSSCADMKKQYTADCKKMGIQGNKIKTEFAALIKDLPSDLRRVAQETASITPAVDYYDGFSSFVIGEGYQSEKELKLLRHIMSKGNTTTFEWRTGKEPSKVEEVEISIDVTDEMDAPTESEAQDIDWGAVDGEGDGGIDFGEEIDFDIGDITVEGGGVEEQETTETSRDSPGSEDIDWCIVDETTLEEKDRSVAKGKDALRVLDNPHTRNLFVDDLHELKAFLAQRINELSKLKGTESHLASAPSQIHLDTPAITEMLSKVKVVLDSLASDKMQHLLLIRDSPRYVDRVRDSLQQKLTLADKLSLRGREMAATRDEAIREESELMPQIGVIRKKTKQLQTQLQGEISKKYDGRRVHIVGEINAI